MTKAAKKRLADKRESVFSLVFGIAFYGAIIGAISQRSGYLDGSYFITTAAVLSWLVTSCVFVAVFAYLITAGKYLKVNWSNTTELDEFCETIKDVIKKTKFSRIIILLMIISALAFVNAGAEAIALSIASGFLVLAMVATVLIAYRRLKAL